jgi:hypothetical protein
VYFNPSGNFWFLISLGIVDGEDIRAISELYILNDIMGEVGEDSPSQHFDVMIGTGLGA